MRLFISLGLVFFLVIGCTSEDSTKEKDVDSKIITNLEEEIIALADSSVCNDETECASIAFGSKPCGGPWSYLVYSTSIDVQLLKDKVKQFNQMQQEFNIKYGIISDCSIALPPTGFLCEDNKCKGIYPQIQQ